MQLTVDKTTSYALCALNRLAHAVAGEPPLTAARIAAECGMPEAVLRKALQSMGRAGFVAGTRGAGYVLGTAAKLVVRFTVAPGLGAAINLAYDFYVPVRFEGDDLPDDQELEAGGLGSAEIVDRTVNVRMREAGPGWSYAAAPSAL